LLEEEQALFTGDTILDGMTSVISPDGGDMAAYLATLDRLAGIGPRRIYPGHGAVIADAVDRIVGYAAHRRAREADIVARVHSEPCRIADLVAAIYPELDPALVPVAEQQVHAHLIKLRADGRVVGRDVRSVWRAT
jgi:glyoxylase-like metal-dependent hydrolase (beta-lactamase superfamily II)